MIDITANPQSESLGYHPPGMGFAALRSKSVLLETFS